MTDLVFLLSCVSLVLFILCVALWRENLRLRGVIGGYRVHARIQEVLAGSGVRLARHTEDRVTADLEAMADEASAAIAGTPALEGGAR